MAGPSIETTKGMEKIDVSGLFGGTTPDKEKPALKSKKFVAYLLSSLGFFIIMGMMLIEQEVSTLAENTAFMVVVITQGFLSTGFILGQAALDKYIRVAKIAQVGHSGEEKNGDDGDGE